MIRQYWKEITIIIILIALIVVGQQLYKAKKQPVVTDILLSSHEAINAINKPIEDVTKRENEVYPKIDKKIDTINNSIKQIDKKINSLEKLKPTKEASYEQFKNKNTSELCSFFTDSGYSCTSTNSAGGR